MEPIDIFSWRNGAWRSLLGMRIFVSQAWHDLFKSKSFTVGAYLPGTSNYVSSTGSYKVSCYQVYKGGKWHRDNFAIIESYRNVTNAGSVVTVNSEVIDMGFIDPAERTTYEFTILYNKCYYNALYANDSGYLNCSEVADGTKLYNPNASIQSDVEVNESYRRLVIRITPCASGTSTLGVYQGSDHFGIRIGNSSVFGIVIHFFYRGGGNSKVCTLSLNKYPSDAVCTLSGAGTYKENTSATAYAYTNSSYWKFSYWSDSGAQSHSLTMDSNKSLIAYFIRRYYVVFGVTDGNGGSVTAIINSVSYTTSSANGIAMYVDSGSSVTLSYQTSTGHTFQQWSDGDGSNTRSLTITSDTTIRATFEANDESLYAAVSRQIGGTMIIGSHVYYTNNTQLITNQDLGTGNTVTTKYGDSITLTSSAGDNMVFVGWSTNSTGGNYISTNSSYTFTMGEGKIVYAVYRDNTYTITLDVDGYGGQTSFDGSTWYNSGTYPTKDVWANTSFDVYANASSGYEFAYWEDSVGNYLSSANPYTHNGVTTNTLVYAKFNKITPTISISRTSYNFAKTGGSFNLNITTNYGWTTGSIASWLSLSSTSGSSSSTITISAAANTIGNKTATIRFYNSYDSSYYVDLTITQNTSQFTLTITAQAGSSTPYPEMYIRSSAGGSNLEYASQGTTNTLSHTFDYGSTWFAFVSSSLTQNGTTYSITSNTDSGTITSNVSKTFVYSEIAATRAGGYRLFRASSTNQYQGTGRPAVNISRNTNGTYYVYADSWSMGDEYWFGCSNLYPFVVVRKISTSAVKEYQVGVKQDRSGNTNWTWPAGTAFRSLGFTTNNAYATTDYEFSIEWRATNVGSDYYTIS